MGDETALAALDRMTARIQRNREVQEAEIARLRAELETAVGLLRRCDGFMQNGIAFGYIQMPEPGVPDPAAETPGLVRQWLAKQKER